MKYNYNNMKSKKDQILAKLMKKPKIANSPNIKTARKRIINSFLIMEKLTIFCLLKNSNLP